MSRDGLFKVLAKIGCPPKLLSLIQSFHAGMKGIIQFDGSSSEAFSISGGMKQGCVLAPTLFGIDFAVMLKQAFGSSTEEISAPDQMASCSACPDLGQRPKSEKFSLETCFSRWRHHSSTLCWAVTVPHGRLFKDQLELWSYNQPQKDEHDGSWCWTCPKNQHQWLWVAGGPGIQLPWFDCERRPLHGSWDWQTDRVSIKHLCQTVKAYMGKLHTDTAQQSSHLQGLRSHYLAVWQWVLDSVLQTRTETQHLPWALLAGHPGHQVVRQGDKQCSARPQWTLQSLHTASAVLSPLCFPHAWCEDLKRSALQRACLLQLCTGTPPSAL